MLRFARLYDLQCRWQESSEQAWIKLILLALYQVTSSSATSATGLLGSRWGHTPSASPRAARANVASFSWLQLRRGASMSSASTNAGAAVACQTGSDPGSGEHTISNSVWT